MESNILAELEKSLTAHPPRAIPSDLVKRAGVEIGGLFSRRAMFFLLILLLAFWVAAFILLPWRYPSEVLVRLGWNLNAHSLVTQREKTSASVGGDSERNVPGVPIYRVHFTVQTQDGKRVEAANYYTGLNRIPGEEEGVFGRDGMATKNFTAEARYLPFSPANALLPDGRLSPFPPYVALVAIFPIGITILWVIFLRKRRRFRTLLRDGELAEAEIAECAKTGTVVNGRPRYKVRLKIIHRLGSDEAGVSVYGQQAELYHRLATEGGRIRVLWLPGVQDAVLPLAANSLE